MSGVSDFAPWADAPNEDGSGGSAAAAMSIFVRHIAIRSPSFRSFFTEAVKTARPPGAARICVRDGASASSLLRSCGELGKFNIGDLGLGFRDIDCRARFWSGSSF